MSRITCAVPEALVFDANQLAMCLGYGPADGETFRAANWQDAQGNLYAAASWEASDEWIATAQGPLTRPAWDTAEIIDMDAAARAQAALTLWTGEGDAPKAQPAELTAIAGVDGVAALAMMGLAPKETE